MLFLRGESMGLYDYIDQFGDKSFLEVSFNAVDAMIFSYLPYVDFRNVVCLEEKLSIKEAEEKYSLLNSKKKTDIITILEACKLFHTIAEKKRYQDCLLSFYEYIGNEKIQFGAISVEYMTNRVFIAYEGTDSLFSGWIENFLLSYRFPTASHKMAIQYLNKHYTFSRKRLILGGHSKGGNLALVAAMYGNFFARLKIDFIYNGDGPGLLEEEFFSHRYQRIQKKYIHLMPEYSVVGVLLNHSNDYVVSANTKSIMAHSIIHWNVEGDSFRTAKLSFFSKELDASVTNWLKKTSLEEKKNIIENLDQILKDANIQSILELQKDTSKVFQFIQRSKELTPDSKKAIKELIWIYLKALEKSTQEEWKSFFKQSFSHHKK